MSKTIEPTPQEAKSLTDAAHFAYAQPDADEFFDEVMAAARRSQARREGQQSHAE